MWIALFVLVALCSLAVIVLPFFRTKETWELPDRDAELERLLAEKSRTLRTLKDLDHEKSSGLLDVKGHAELRQEYLEQAVQLNRAIASLTGVDPSRLGGAVAEVDA